MNWLIESEKNTDTDKLIYSLIEMEIDFSIRKYDYKKRKMLTETLVQSNTVPIGSEEFVSWVEDQYTKMVWRKPKEYEDLKEAFNLFYLYQDAEVIPFNNFLGHVKGKIPIYDSIRVIPIGDCGLLSNDITIRFSESKMFYDCYSRKNNDFYVAISKEKEITHKYRFVVVDGKIITGCCYYDVYKNEHYNIDTLKEDVVFLHAETFANLWKERVFILDIARVVMNGKLYHRVISAEYFNISSFYSCNRRAIIEALEDYPMEVS